MISRILRQKLETLFKNFPIVMLMGPRQSGKTTLVRQTFQDLPYVSLEEYDIRQRAEEDPRGFLAQYRNGAIFDEAQKAPNLFSFMQGVVDKTSASGQFVLTGSQNFLLLEKVTQSLAGRVGILKLLPLSYEELQNSKLLSLEFTYEELIFKGFYPRLYREDQDVLAPSPSPREYYSSYIQTYIERDVRQIQNVGDLSSFQKFVGLCAGRVGQLLNFSALATDAGISHNTAKAWVSILEASFIIFLLRPHHNNYNKRLTKSTKLYFYDTGLASAILGIRDAAGIENHYLRGSLFENFIIAEYFKNFYNRGEDARLFFWRDRSGNEIDLIWDQGTILTPVEIKSAKTRSDDFYGGLKYWNRLSGNKENNSWLIYGGDQSYINPENGSDLGWRDMLQIFDKRK